jgi:hypothetical protein
MNISARTGKALYWFFSFVVVALAFRWALPGGVTVNIPAMAHHIEDGRAVWLYLHMLGSLVPMALIPFQISDRFRMKHKRLHKWMGWASVAGIVVGGLTLLPLTLHIPVPAWGRFGFALAGMLWFAAGMIGLYFIAVRRDLKRHKFWMTMTAVIIFGAVTQRFALPIWISMGFEWKIAYSLSAYSGWTVNLSLYFLWKNRRSIRAALGGARATAGGR